MKLSETYPISLLCAVLGLARSSFHYVKETLEEAVLQHAIEGVAARFPTYGTRRVTHQVRREAPTLLPLNRKRVQRVMREKRLLVKRKKRTPKTTNSQHAFEIVSRVVEIKFQPPRIPDGKVEFSGGLQR